MTTNTPANFAVGSWAFSVAHGESVRILDVETVWNHTVYQVWIPRLGTVERVPAASLAPVQPTKATGIDRITYAVAAARIADALTQDVLLAPLEAGVIPLPHQLHALTCAVTGDRVRYLLADEVGLGKTIEAGLIFRELKLRGLVKRVLVVAPKELVTQWVQEMQTHFGEGRMMKRMTRRMTTRTRRMRGSRTPRSVSFDLSMHGPETARTLLPTWASGVAVDTFTKRSTT